MKCIHTDIRDKLLPRKYNLSSRNVFGSDLSGFYFSTSGAELMILEVKFFASCFEEDVVAAPPACCCSRCVCWLVFTYRLNIKTFPVASNAFHNHKPYVLRLKK